MSYGRYERSEWVPKTKLGKLVKKGEINNISDALNSGLPLRETEIVDMLLPGMDDEVLNVNMVQRMTDSGRRVRFTVISVVGNQDGFVGIGEAKGKEVGPAIRKSIKVAKLNLIEIKRGCGSWECGCGTGHTLPFSVTGRSGSVRVTFRPAPRGVGLAVGDVAKHVLRMAGIEDAWGFTKGKTRTTVNYAKAAFDCLWQTVRMRVSSTQMSTLEITSGSSTVTGTLPEEDVATQIAKEKGTKEEAEAEKGKEKEDEGAPEEKKEKTEKTEAAAGKKEAKPEASTGKKEAKPEASTGKKEAKPEAATKK